MNYRKWHAGKAKRSERARRAAEARWTAARALLAGEPTRRTRIVEFPIRDTHRPFSLIRMEADEAEHGFSRWAVYQDNVRIGRRRFGRTKVAAMIAEVLQ